MPVGEGSFALAPNVTWLLKIALEQTQIWEGLELAAARSEMVGSMLPVLSHTYELCGGVIYEEQMQPYLPTGIAKEDTCFILEAFHSHPAKPSSWLRITPGKIQGTGHRTQLS